MLPVIVAPAAHGGAVTLDIPHEARDAIQHVLSTSVALRYFVGLGGGQGLRLLLAPKDLEAWQAATRTTAQGLVAEG